MNSTYPSFGARATILLALGMVGCGGGGGGTKDTTAPTAVISLDRTAALNGEIVVATVTASENVIGFTSADVSVVNGTVESVIVVSGSVYQVVVRMGATGSTCSFTIPNGAFTDRAGNELVAGGGGSVSLLPKDTGWASATGVNAQGKDFADLTVGTKTLRFVWIAAGTYEQGSPTSETSRNTDENKRTVTLTKGFWISQTEVPNSFWLATAPGYPASVTIPDDNKPVSGRTVSQIDGFIPLLAAEKPMVSVLRLPTEAEWEYAARAGTTGPFSFVPSPDTTQVNCRPLDSDVYIPLTGTSNTWRNVAVDVASLPANPWGLYEVHGNLWELCLDFRDGAGGYASTPVVDPYTASGSNRIVRGGAHDSSGKNIRSANRFTASNVDGLPLVGFRLVITDTGVAPSGGG